MVVRSSDQNLIQNDDSAHQNERNVKCDYEKDDA